jgi:hypothetical protein
VLCAMEGLLLLLLFAGTASLCASPVSALTRSAFCKESGFSGHVHEVDRLNTAYGAIP